MARAKTSGKATPKKTAPKTASRKTARRTTGVVEGSKYTCGVCGLSVVVDNACGCDETAHLVCCERPMRMKR